MAFPRKKKEKKQVREYTKNMRSVPGLVFYEECCEGNRVFICANETKSIQYMLNMIMSLFASEETAGWLMDDIKSIMKSKKNGGFDVELMEDLGFKFFDPEETLELFSGISCGAYKYTKVIK